MARQRFNHEAIRKFAQEYRAQGLNYTSIAQLLGTSHRHLRSILRGARLQAPLRKQIYTRDNYTCQLHLPYCQKTKDLELWRKDGNGVNLDPANLLTVCRKCHYKKLYPNRKVAIICVQCKKRRSLINVHGSARQAIKFCSRKCQYLARRKYTSDDERINARRAISRKHYWRYRHDDRYYRRLHFKRLRVAKKKALTKPNRLLQ